MRFVVYLCLTTNQEEVYHMKPRKWKSFLSLCMAAALAISTVSYGSQITITPLDINQEIQSAEGGSVSQAGPSVETSPAVVAGPPSETAGETGAAADSTGKPAAAQTPKDQPEAAANIDKPVIEAEGAVLMNGATGEVIFGKNQDTRYYPASITKLMTALLIAENCGLDDTVKFSKTATTNLESGAVNIKMTEGDTMTVRQCLYALLLKSANEVGNALAEHMSGSNAKFAEQMNARAAALGCTNTHFTNPHGLNDTEHYTTPRDMGLIAKAAFENEIVKTVASTRTYTLPATKNNPSGLTVTMGHKMINSSDSRYYPGIIGGKTGYTSKAGNTLVTAVEKDGVRLIAVVMKCKSTHYTDTKKLLDYGYELAEAGALSKDSGTDTAKASQTGTDTNTAKASQTGIGGTQTGTAGPSGPGVQTGWLQKGSVWYYIKSDGTRVANQWLTVNGLSYWFDSDGAMAKGWRQIGGIWYYLRSDGSMAKNYWCYVSQNGKWFYLGSDGAMLVNTTTPDGYQVDADGAWIQ